MTEAPRRARAIPTVLDRWHENARVPARRPVTLDSSSWTDIVITLKSRLSTDSGQHDRALKQPAAAPQPCAARGAVTNVVTMCSEEPQPAKVQQPQPLSTTVSTTGRQVGSIGARLHASALTARSARSSKPRSFHLTLTLPPPPPPAVPKPATSVALPDHAASQPAQDGASPSVMPVATSSDVSAPVPPAHADAAPSNAAVAMLSSPSPDPRRYCSTDARLLSAATASDRRNSLLRHHTHSPAVTLGLSPATLSLARTPIEGVPERMSLCGVSSAPTPHATPNAAGSGTPALSSSVGCSLAATPIEGIPEMSLRLPWPSRRAAVAAAKHVPTVPPTPWEGVPERAAPYFTPGFALRRQLALAAAVQEQQQDHVQLQPAGANKVAEDSEHDAAAAAAARELAEDDDQVGELLEAEVLECLPQLADEMSSNDPQAAVPQVARGPAVKSLAEHPLAGCSTPAVDATATMLAFPGACSHEGDACDLKDPVAPVGRSSEAAVHHASPPLKFDAARLLQRACDTGQQFPSPAVTQASQRRDVGPLNSTLAELAVSSVRYSGASVYASQRAGHSSAPGLTIISAGPAATPPADPADIVMTPLIAGDAPGAVARQQCDLHACDANDGPSMPAEDAANSDDDSGGDNEPAAGPSGWYDEGPEPGTTAGAAAGAAAQEEDEQSEDSEAADEHDDGGTIVVGGTQRHPRCSDVNVRERDLYRKRKSLAGGGIIMDEDLGVRRSTRQHQRPLEYWRNEHKRYGRQHKSLPTVISVATLTPDPQWPAPSDKAHHKRTRARTVQ